MRIGIGDGYNKLAPAPTDAARKGAATGQVTDSSSGTSAAGGAVSGEKVTVSAEAQRLADQAAAGSDSKVESLRASIAAGTFQIDRQAVAAGIVDEGSSS